MTTTSSNTNRSLPVQSVGLSQVRAVSGGFSHSMALGIRAGVVLSRLMANFEWSSVTLDVATQSVELSSAIALDAETASDTTHYVIAVNGVETEVRATSAGDSVTLKLGANSFKPGDEVTVTWSGLRDAKGNPLAGGSVSVTVRE